MSLSIHSICVHVVYSNIVYYTKGINNVYDTFAATGKIVENLLAQPFLSGTMSIGMYDDNIFTLKYT